MKISQIWCCERLWQGIGLSLFCWHLCIVWHSCVLLRLFLLDLQTSLSLVELFVLFISLLKSQDRVQTCLQRYFLEFLEESSRVTFLWRSCSFQPLPRFIALSQSIPPYDCIYDLHIFMQTRLSLHIIVYLFPKSLCQRPLLHFNLLKVCHQACHVWGCI